MISKNLAFIAVKPIGNQFRAYLSMEAAIISEKDPKELLQEATNIYEDAIGKMTQIVDEIRDARKNRRPVGARQIWQLGDFIFRLRDQLEEIGLQLDSVYEHLARDLEVKSKWLEKVIILRRYLPDKKQLPESLNWGRLEKGTSRKAKQLKSGLPIS